MVTVSQLFCALVLKIIAIAVVIVSATTNYWYCAKFSSLGTVYYGLFQASYSLVGQSGTSDYNCDLIPGDCDRAKAGKATIAVVAIGLAFLLFFSILTFILKIIGITRFCSGGYSRKASLAGGLLGAICFFTSVVVYSQLKPGFVDNDLEKDEYHFCMYFNILGGLLCLIACFCLRRTRSGGSYNTM